MLGHVQVWQPNSLGTPELTLTHTEAARLQVSGLEAVHKLLTHIFLSSRCVWHCMNQPHTNVFPSVWLPNNRTHLTTCRQPGTHHSRAAATHTDDSERDRSPKVSTTSYETKTAVSHRLISLIGILVNGRRTNCCWIFSYGQDVHNIMQSLWMLGRGSEHPPWLRLQGHLAQ